MPTVDPWFHWRARLRRALALSISTTALSGLVYLEGFPARADTPEATSDPISAASPAAEPSPETPPADVETLANPESGSFAMPDLAGMKLRQARRELKAAGLRLVVRDEYGGTIDPDDVSRYVVRGQTIEPGTVVAPGSWVRLVVGERWRSAQGY